MRFDQIRWSNDFMTTGNGLIDTLIVATGLPKEALLSELERLAERQGRALPELTLAELRTILAEYLQDVLMEAKYTN